MKIRSFKFYDNYYLLLTLLNEHDRETMADSILKYMFEGIEPNFEVTSKCYAVWTNMKIALDKQQTNSLNGQKGGAPEGNKNAKKTSENTSQKTSEKQPNKQPKKQPNNILSLLFNISYFQDKGLLREKITDWISYKHERKESYREKGFKSLLTQIEKNCKKYGERNVIDLIDECMASNYKGIIFEKLKGKQQIIPEWTDKEVSNSEELSEEELVELQEIVKEFK